MLHREQARLLLPQNAEGRATINLTDPTTGKIKEQIKAKNHVYKDGLFTAEDWIANMATTLLVLANDGAAIDPDFPYVRGVPVGYGKPNTAGTGTIRGAFNAANQILAQQTQEKIYWKFQYDFTTAQANGTIRNLGLTHQFSNNAPKTHPSFLRNNKIDKATYTTNDGRYAYSCSTAGVITKTDLLFGEGNVTINVSAIVGTNSNDYKVVCYAPDTGKYYVYVGSSTAASRKMYRFSNNNFTALEQTYAPTNSTTNTNATPGFVYGNKVYFLGNSNITYADFVANTYTTNLTPPTISAVATTEGSATTYVDWPTCALAYDKYLIPGCTNQACVALDMSTNQYIATLVAPNLPNLPDRAVMLPTAKTHKLPVWAAKALPASFVHRSAISALVLPTPVTKTSANGMTVTYELEVFW